jgi:hypothetical protein
MACRVCVAVHIYIIAGFLCCASSFAITSFDLRRWSGGFDHRKLVDEQKQRETDGNRPR